VTLDAALGVKGFLAEAEGLRLYELALEASRAAPLLEIGSYCGRSALFLGAGCRDAGVNPVFTVDHHLGSEEQQPGATYFDPELWDDDAGETTTLRVLVRNLRRAGLADWVLPVVARSTVAARAWPDATLALLFVDGGHSDADAFGDYRAWARCVRPRGYLCVHDVFPDPADGGQAPYRVVCEATERDGWEHVDTVESLVVLRRP
jgi:MMP 1-O-methyltransferase